MVYLAISSGLKVGITSRSNIENRWIDQGASHSILFSEVPYRYLSGCIEVALKAFVSDRTSWQKMLKNDFPNINLISEKNRLSKLIITDYKQYLSCNNHLYSFDYPVIQYPKKIKSINLDNLSSFKKTLIGIKGQYLIFEDNTVLNIRKHSGYEVIIM